MDGEQGTTGNMRQRRWQCGGLAAILFASLLLSACGNGDENEDVADSTSTVAAQTQGGADTSSQRPCDDDGITLADLAIAEAEWPQRREEIEAAGKEWQDDATLVEVWVHCAIIGNLEWDGIYYSPSQQSWYSTERAEVLLPEEGPTTEPLDPSIVSFAKLAEWLRADGFSETMVMGLGIEVGLGRVPQDAPPGVPFYRVSKEQTEEDFGLYLYVNAQDGTVVRD